MKLSEGTKCCWRSWKLHANIPPKAYGWQVVLTRYIRLHSLATFYLQMCPIAPLQFGVTTWFLLVVWPHFRLYQRAKHAAISLPRPKPFGWVNHSIPHVWWPEVSFWLVNVPCSTVPPFLVVHSPMFDHFWWQNIQFCVVDTHMFLGFCSFISDTLWISM